MAASVNKATILGYLGDDPKVADLPEGGRVANLSVATSENWKGEDGEKKERTTWHRVAIFSAPLVELAEKYLRKGSRVYLEGSLQNRQWQDREGVERFSTEIVLRPYSGSLTLLDAPTRAPDRPRPVPKSSRRRGFGQASPA